ncbi:MAG: EAL domain-containing protein [Dactylosporangium sp.]|nr:EAL domain-containing protein [Dactylosporangium sp.]NNJ61476.1 EAL domain-containing protein [Dactylosporangium sp.]
MRPRSGLLESRSADDSDSWSQVDWCQAIASVLRDLSRPALVAQPVVELATGGIAGYELLARFGGSIKAPPDVWFRQADRLGLATALTTRVLDQAFALRPHLPPGCFLAVNVEPHLLSDPAIMHALRSGPPLHHIVIELTGHTPVRDERALQGAVEWIRAAGGLIAVDDAGTGYAGLRQLLTVRPDIVKVDRTLIAGIDTDPIKRGAVTTLSDLVSRMDSKMLAEGVETLGELQVLASLGVPLAQGWLLAKPAPPWPSLDPETVDTVHTTVAQSRLTDQLAPLVRKCITVDRSVWCASNAAPPNADRRETVVIDGSGRPIGIVAREAKGNRYLAPVMAVTSSASPIEVVKRAMARAACHRGVSLVCVDARGHSIGVIDISELVEAAITEAMQ